MSKPATVAALLLFSVAACTGWAQKPVMAATPPMGWSTWNHFHHDISDALVRREADALVSSGMRDAGYVYVNIDGGWQGYRDAQGVLHPNSNFPDMKALGRYIHSKGLRFGIYSGPGPRSCAGQPTSYGYEAQDARMFASWGVDFLKYDLCSFRDIMKEQSKGDVAKSDALMKAAYEKMHEALEAAGRPILFSLCQYGWGEVWTWGPEVGASMWRTGEDISDRYDSMSLNGFGQAGLEKFAGPGHWNDPDFLEVGNGGMTEDEQKTHFSLWAMMAAPLIAGNDLTQMSEQTRRILLNREIIAVDQDALGRAASRVFKAGPIEVWARPLEGGAMAVALFNRTTGATRITLRLKDVGWQGPAAARDLWEHKGIGVLSPETAFTVPAHGVTMLRLTHPER
ncbi:MAG TPA: glycoside hydrolase family 27 protein [Terracidiphilus sp.]|nr:glycoside hydrolase family 27 protein [Terracidiphilus sp.]